MCISLVALIPFYLALYFPNGSCTRVDDENRLHKHLFANYNKDIMPTYATGTPVQVFLSNKLRRVVHMDEKDQKAEVFWWLRKYWTDARLTWNASDYGGLDSIRVTSDDIWVPDTTVFNSNFHYEESQMTFKELSHAIGISSNGLVLWMAPMTTLTICIMELGHYPYDEQICEVTFGSWTADSSVINYTIPENEKPRSEYLRNEQWRLNKLSVKLNSIKYSCCPYPYVTIIYKFRLMRRKDYPTFNFIIPSIILASLVLLVFLLPPESGERASLSINILLSITIFQQIAAENIPPTQVPAIGIFYFSTLVTTSFALVLTTFILRIYHHGDRPVPEFARRFVLHGLGRFVSCKRKKKTLSKLIQSSLFQPLDTNIETHERLTERPTSHAISHDGTVNYPRPPRRSLLKKNPSRQTPIHEPTPSQEAELDAYEDMIMGIRQDWNDLVFILDRFAMIILSCVLIISVASFFIVVHSNLPEEGDYYPDDA